MGDPHAWLDGLDVVELDSEKLRALAHPTRSQIVSTLRLDGPATSAGLAQRLDTNTGQTSYHVRALADVGLVVEDPDRGTARERWWKAAQRGHSWADPDDLADPDDRHSADWLLRHHHRDSTRWVSEWFDARPGWSRDWRAATSHGDGFFVGTPEDLRAFGDELGELIERYHQRGQDRDPDDADVHHITAIYHAFPTQHLRT